MAIINTETLLADLPKILTALAGRFAEMLRNPIEGEEIGGTYFPEICANLTDRDTGARCSVRLLLDYPSDHPEHGKSRDEVRARPKHQDDVGSLDAATRDQMKTFGFKI